MKLGIDFGTNRIVVAASDRGNFPLVSFDGPEGVTFDWFPSLIGVRGQERRYGWDAWECQTDDSWIIIRSIKRFLEDAGPQTSLDVGPQSISLTSALNGLAAAVLSALRDHSNLHLAANENLQAVLGVPAHANSNQRFLTVEAFRSAGLEVLGVLNEPSAASIEFGHRQRQNKAMPETILVYDLGGGTFDVSLVTLHENVHHVVASDGISTIGGDDFDQILADLALDAAGIDSSARHAVSPAEWFRLLEECRIKKEALNPNSRRIVIDLENANPDWASVQIPVADFYEEARPLMEETIDVAEQLVEKYQEGGFEALYITGGGSELPLVARVLREKFGRRVRRSAYTRSATAIGLAIQAGQPETYRLSERLTRFFGVWRETDSGSRVVFDPLFSKGISLPAPGDAPLEIRRSYSPVHNVGHFRFLECSHRSADGSPSGEIMIWDQIWFPFDPALSDLANVKSVAVAHSELAGLQQIEERYTCDSTGSITVEIANLVSGYSRVFRLGHWNTDQNASIKSSQRRKSTAKATATVG